MATVRVVVENHEGTRRGTSHDTNATNTAHNNGSRSPMQRKPSSPMLPAFMVSAPGKVIMFGEHSVVHGKPAIAASIALRSYLLVTTLSKSKRTVTLKFVDIKLDHTWDIDTLPWNLFSAPGKKKYYYDLVTELDTELLDAIKPFLETVATHLPKEQRRLHQSAASSFLYMFLSLGSQSFPGCIYTLRSTVPIGAGLGSSASIAVCMSAALLLQLRALSGPHPDQPPEEARLQVERINRWALVGEMVIHGGTASGVDNTVASQGKAVIYRRGDLDNPPVVTPLWNFPVLRLLLIDTKQSKSTAVEVAKVRDLKRIEPDIVDSIMTAMERVAESVIKLLLSRNFDPTSDKSLSRVGELMRINHGLLVALGVSHPRLERVRELVDHEGLGWSKLTGAGGGGCSITLLKPDTEDTPAKMTKLERSLESEGYVKFETKLGGHGVGVLWPAVLKNGLEAEDEARGMEIHLDDFLAAEGTEGVERLVGVHSGDGGEREGWKFWRVESDV